MLEYVLAASIGILAGIFTGLFPGIHINLVSYFIIISLTWLLDIFPPLAIIIFIVSMSITHVFFDFLPSVYLGAPDDSGLSVMPGHAMLIEGKGHEAVCLILIGAFSSIIISILLIPLLLFIMPRIYPFIERMMAWLLILASCFLIFKEKNSKLNAFIVFCLAGFLGIITTNLQLNQPLLPLLSGLFGSSSLIYSLSQKTTVPEQKLEVKIIKKELIKPVLTSSLISPICAFLPGMGGSQAAVISSEFCKPDQKQFLVLLGSVNLMVMALSFLALYSLDKARTGSAAAVQQITSISCIDLIIIFFTLFIVSTISLILAIKTSKFISNKITSISYSKISFCVIIILTLSVLIFSSMTGFLIYITATSIGLLAYYFEVRKGHLMACLLVPTILFYLPF